MRLAFVTSVTCTPPFVPPVRFQITQVSMLPNTRSPASAFARAPSTLSRIHRTFGPEKYVAIGSPVDSAEPVLPSVLRQLVAELVGAGVLPHERVRDRLPVFLSHTTVVSRWFVTPTAAMSLAEMPAFFSPAAITSCVRDQISIGSCSTQPGFGKICSCSFCAMPFTLPPWSKTMKRVLVVPWSMAPTKSAMSGKHLLFPLALLGSICLVRRFGQASPTCRRRSSGTGPTTSRRGPDGRRSARRGSSHGPSARRAGSSRACPRRRRRPSGEARRGTTPPRRSRRSSASRAGARASIIVLSSSSALPRAITPSTAAREHLRPSRRPRAPPCRRSSRRAAGTTSRTADRRRRRPSTRASCRRP